ncbi:cyclophilin-like fold protein [Aquiflexum sp.]|uniref:cyclophilin-like fold protein n=1 Tax=Aquiflexum sp. TaxID=1872584 RepID=UPI003593B811
MKRITVMGIVCMVMIAGYASQQQPSVSLQEPNNNQSSDITNIPEEIPVPSESETLATLQITVGDEILTATLWSNPASESLLAQLPLTLAFEDYGGRELIAEPFQPITMEGMPERDSPQEGDLSFYAPSNALSLTYADLGEWVGAVRLGRIEGDLSILKNHSEPVMVMIEQVE